MFSAILIEKDDNGQTVARTDLDEAQLPDGDVTVDVEYSTLNYKDGLAITGRSPVVRKFPMVPGIDLAGTVTDSSHADCKAGDHVVLNGWGVGETHWGGLAQRARAQRRLAGSPAGRVHPRQAMAIGTAGYTAMLCVDALQRARRDARAGRGAGDRRRGRRRQRRDRAADEAWAISVVASTGRSCGSGVSRRGWARGDDRPRRTCRSRASRCRRNAGRASSMRSAATRWPTPARRPVTAARSRRAAWRRAWISRRRWRRSSCAA